MMTSRSSVFAFSDRFASVALMDLTPFVAEQLFACGCELLVSVASAGKVAPHLDLPAYVLIERALRD